MDVAEDLAKMWDKRQMELDVFFGSLPTKHGRLPSMARAKQASKHSLGHGELEWQFFARINQVAPFGRIPSTPGKSRSPLSPAWGNAISVTTEIDQVTTRPVWISPQFQFQF